MKYITGIRPSGHIHLGNYLGAIKPAKELGCTMFVADLHGLYDAVVVRQTINCLRRFGIEPLIQSEFGATHLRSYADLLHHATIGQLSRMTQYKEKSQKESVEVSLLTYPVLMAADIFYLQGTHIPVGNDQLQHIEFVRDLWDKVKPDAPKPEAVTSEYPRIMSLTDGTKKMSKSDWNDRSIISLDDTTQIIREKIMAAKTAMSIDDDTPEMVNLRTIYKAVGGAQKHTKLREFKDELAELIIKELAL